MKSLVLMRRLFNTVRQFCNFNIFTFYYHSWLYLYFYSSFNTLLFSFFAGSYQCALHKMIAYLRTYFNTVKYNRCFLFSVPFEEFVNNVTAIQCTEVYEYSMSLGNPNFVLPSFQLFRFMYLVRLVDYGLLEEVMS